MDENSKENSECTPSFGKLLVNSKEIDVKQLRIFLIPNIWKETIKKIMNSWWTFSKSRPTSTYNFEPVLMSCPCPFKQCEVSLHSGTRY
jgi:hypothetical protein